jgi:nitrogen-specific signal transduction histidine kinase/ActR/RegA family two-component response regulator
VGIVADDTERIELEAQLRQAQKMEAVGHLTGGIAHDFNNLLAVILGNAEILAEEVADPQLREIASLVMQTAERGAELTQHLLAFGRRQALRPTPLRLDEAIASFSDVLRRTLGEPIRLVTASPGDLPPAMVDRPLFESAILNLAVNARDAMPEGGELSIETATIAAPGAGVPRELAPGRYLRVTVRDTGIGIAADVLPHVFEPFFTTKDVGHGSGLGLPMVYGFAQQSRGHVLIESALGKGTAVHLFLPEASPSPEAARPAPEGAEAPGGTEPILLVEDEPEVRRFVARQLAALGYPVLEAENGDAALDLLSRGAEVGLLFSDIVLSGGMSGFQLVERARIVRPSLKAVLTTGYTQEYANFERSGSELVLKKPYRRQELAWTLRAALEATPEAPAGIHSP